MDWLGLDIGGANLKAACGTSARQAPFQLWRHPDKLSEAVAGLLAAFPKSTGLALTMTGELCDCFATKAEGVRRILDAVELAGAGRPLRVWTTEGRFITANAARRKPLLAAAANWLALATFVGQLAPRGSALVIDLGSTTADIIPLLDGTPTPIGWTDPDRLASSELVYTGVKRTPLCALFGLAKATELFATTEDVYVTLGELPERPKADDTADGRPMTKRLARIRLARMECDDARWSEGRARMLAAEARNIQVAALAERVRRVASRLPGTIERVVLAGAGEFLIPDVLEHAGLDVAVESLKELLGPTLSICACACAVSRIACRGGELP